jgi:hypothetical protein
VGSIRVPAGFKVTLYDSCTQSGPSGNAIAYSADALKARGGKGAIVVERIGFEPTANGLIGQDYPCQGSTCGAGRCCVPADQAHMLCRQDPKCKYVETTTNPAWNAENPNSAALRTGVRRPNADWKSEEKTFDAPKDGMSGQDYECPSTSCPGKCCVRPEDAYKICAADPKCKYVETSKDPAKQDPKMLRTGDLKPSAEWSAEPKTSPDAGKALPVALFTGPNFTDKSMELKEPGVYTDCKQQLAAVGRNTVSSVRVPPGFIVALYPDCSPAGPVGTPIVLTQDALNLPPQISKKVAAVAVMREGWKVPENGKSGQDFACAETTCPNACCVPLDKAHDICRKDPRCKYVETTTDPTWNNANPNSAALRTGTQRPAPGWKSEEKNFEPELPGLKGQDYKCEGSTCQEQGCCLPAGVAHEKCVQDPKCMYVETSLNPQWNAQNPDTKVLRTGDRVKDANWSSEKKLPSVAPEGSKDAGSTPPVTVFTGPNLTGIKQELPNPFIYKKPTLTVNVTKDSSIYVPPGFQVYVFKTLDDKGQPSNKPGDYILLKNTQLKLPGLGDKTAPVIMVQRIGFEGPGPKDLAAENYSCPGSACGAKMCCVPSNVAHLICDKDPKCKYVATPNAKAIEANPDLKAAVAKNPYILVLQTGLPKPTPGWTIEPKKDAAFPASCQIGPNPTSSTKTVPIPFAGTKVPATPCGIGCRKNTDNLSEAAVFSLAMDPSGKNIIVKRTDKDAGWTQNLQIPCNTGDDSLGNAAFELKEKK